MRLILALLVSSTALPQDRAYSPEVAAASEEGALALLGIQVPEGLRADLFAAEPRLANPVAFCIDERGRFFVAESFRIESGVTDTRRHMEWLDDDLAARTVEDRVAMYRKHLGDVTRSFTAEHERVRLIEDLDGDGKADRSTVFADGFNDIADGIGAGLLARQGTVWFTCIPHLWLLRDQDGDRRADSRAALHSGYGVHVGYYGHDLHGLRFGPDGRLYFSIGDRGLNVMTEGRNLVLPDTGAVLRCEPDGSRLEVFATGLRNPQELAFDDHGDLFTGDNNSDGGDRARWVHLVEGGDSGWRIGYQFLSSPVPRGPWNVEKLWLPRRDGQPAYLVPPVANIADGPSGLAYYPGTGLPWRYDRHFFLCDFRGVSGQSGILSFALRESGASHELRDEHRAIWSVLATDVDFGVDGALYLTDWVEGWGKTGKGRIYRVSDPSKRGDPMTAEVRKFLGEGMSHRSTAELSDLLEHRDHRVRQEAQFALAERGLEAVPTLLDVARAGGHPLARLHAIWGLGQVGRRERKALEGVPALLSDSDAEVRAQSAHVLGEGRMPAAFDGLVRLLEDPRPRVRFFAALSLGKLGRPEAVGAVLRMLEENAERDPYLRHAGVMALTRLESPAGLLRAAGERSPAIRMGILLALRRQESPEVARFLGDPEERLRLEAARAVHDLPLAAALPRLAALPVNKDTPEVLAWRILNANFRLGGAENARVVARAAGTVELSEWIRVEALEELADWPRPSGRDRVMGLWRPLEPRPAELAREALRPELSRILRSAPEAVRRAGLEASVRLSLKEAGAVLAELAGDRECSAGFRAQVLRSLEALADARLLDTVKEALADREPAVRREAQRLLAKLRPAEAIGALEAALEKGSTEERQGALSTLSGMEGGGATAVLQKWMEKLLSGAAPAEIRLDILEAAARRRTPALDRAVARYEAARSPDDPLAPFRECLLGGDRENGRKVLRERESVSCLRCHRFQGHGGEVGPDLTGIGARQNREYLLESLVAPSRQISKGFDTVVLLTREGRAHTGVLKDEDQRHVRLTTADGKLLSVPKDRIRARTGGLSAMPEDAVKLLTKRELRDLVECLAAER